MVFSSLNFLFFLLPGVLAAFDLYPEHLSASQGDLAACGIRESGRLRKGLAENSLPGYVDGWELFESLKAHGVETHFRTDTHFNFAGSIPWMEALISAIDPDAWDPGSVRDLGTVTFQGNLASVIVPGLTEDVRKLIVDRGLGREPDEQLDAPIARDVSAIRRYRAENAGVALIQAETLVLGDSYLILRSPHSFSTSRI